MRLVNRNDLEGWAQQFDSKGYLPILISRLIRATTSNGTYVDFPSGSASFIGGLDGIVNCQEDCGYVPSGLSLWELGTESDIKGKADDDYDKRTLDPLDYDITQATFIFVTPRFWKLKEKWRTARLREGKWKDVKVYDSSILEQWLDIAGAVSRWFSGYLTKYPSDGIITVEEFWKEWAVGPLGRLPPGVVTSGREIESGHLLNFLSNRPNITGVQATSKDEAIAFIIASANQFQEQHKEKFCSKTLIIDTSNNFRSVRINTRALNLIVRFDEPQVLFAAAADGHHVLVPLGPDDTFNQEIITLPTLPRKGQIDALIQMGITEYEAEKFSREAGRNITILKRLLRFPQNLMKWAKSESVREIIPAMLLGRWNESKTGDIALIEKLSGESYDQYLVKLNKWKNVEEPPIIQIGETWRLTSPLDVWTNISALLLKSDLETLKESYLMAFKDGNPLAEPRNDSEKMMFAFNKEKIFSSWSREGINQSLILIGLYGKGLQIPNMTNPQTWVDHIIRTLLYKGDGKLWLSLDHELPLISEASPDSFIEALYEAFNSTEKPLASLFVEENSFIHKTSHHTGLLWALEGLAWMPEYVNDASLILSKLAAIDPGGSLANRPFNSLLEIFKPWHYQTLADFDLRMQTLQRIARENKLIAWNILIKLLPNYHGIAQPTHKMRWRTFDKNFNVQYFYEEIYKTYSYIVDMLISLYEGTDEQLSILLNKSVDLGQDDRNKILDFSNEVYAQITFTEDKSWSEIRSILAQHRSHPDTDWALSEIELSKYEQLYHKLTPADFIRQNIWLFDSWPQFPEGESDNTAKGDYLRLQDKVDSRRKEAVKIIISEYGTEKLIELSRQVKEPWVFGLTAGEIIKNDEQTLSLIKKINFEDNQELRFIQNFLVSRSIEKTTDWIAEIYQLLVDARFSNDSLAKIFIPLTPSVELWNIIDSTNAEIKKIYWVNVQPWFYKLNAEAKVLGLNYLLKYQRYYTAIDTISHFSEDIPSDLIIEALVSAATKEASEPVRFKNYEIGSLFNTLDSRNDVENNNIIHLEWLYMPILSGYGTRRTPKSLHEELNSSPQFFVDVLKWIYMPKNRNLMATEREGIADEALKNRAEQAYNLLNSWKTVPGTDIDGIIDADFLNNWITRARSIAVDVDRLEVADLQIGRILAQYPEKDLSWPPDSISEIIEKINTESLKNNFSSAVFNKRGSSTRGPFDGGTIERAHANYFNQLYTYHKNKHPHVAEIFNNLSKRYIEHAKQMDDAAERDKLEY